MGGEDLALEEAGGLEDGSIGTDAERVRAAIERAMSDDGVLVLMDLGSALMSTEMAIELMEGDGRVVMSAAPLVEGAVAAAAAARGGASLDEVRAEAQGALAMKSAQLGGDELPGGEGAAASNAGPPDAQARFPVVNAIGLHARPAALVVELAGRFDAELRLAKADGAGAPVSARSLTGLMTLAARRGDELVATAAGPQASVAVAALEELAAGGFGEGVADGAAPRAAAAATAPARAPEPAKPAAPPPPGTTLTGIAASTGIAAGPVRHLDRPTGPPPDREPEDADAELARLERARDEAREAIAHDRDEVSGRGGVSEAEIFNAHLALLDDDALLARTRELIGSGATAERAWHDAAAETATQLRSLDDPLLSARAVDVEDVGGRVVAALTGAGPAVALEGVIVGDELTPRETAALDPELVKAIATARGTPTAHAAILARALGLPCVVGLGPEVLAIPDGTPVLLDGDRGTVLVAPDERVEAEARERAAQATARRSVAREHASEPAVMRDGTVIEVAANIGGSGEAARAVELGADGVGLLRTEFLFLERPEIPSEDEQVRTLAAIAAELGDRPLIVRTLDVGADKPLQAVPMESEANPFLGRRGLRLGLERPELLEVQLRAICRVASERPLRMMFPMVAAVSELDAALEVLDRARADTGGNAQLEVGIMVEVPAAALLAEQFAERVDFFSVGTNDLTQYTMAAERGNEHVAGLLSGPQPAVLRLIRDTAAGAAAHSRWVGVCGELAGDPAAAVLLVGLGVRELSMAAPLIAEVKQTLRTLTLEQAGAAAAEAVQEPDSAAARLHAAALS